MLTLHGTQRNSVFNLSRDDENSATFALGWTLDKSLAFRRLILNDIFSHEMDVTDAQIALQNHASGGGYTDIEVSGPGFHAIFEAKRGWDIPTVQQLKSYLPRLATGDRRRNRLVTVSAADPSHARRHLPEQIEGVEITHLSWRSLQKTAGRASVLASGYQEKLWLRELIQHLQEFVSMDRQLDNKTYVVSLRNEAMVPGQVHTYIDVVEIDHCYFHPIAKTWPVRPPNYIGFRYRGRLQSVHHVDSFEVRENLSSYNALWPETFSDHFVYRLGPPMRPASPMRTGNIYRSGRVWCAIDALLSGAFDTISDARDETDRRIEQAL